MLGLGAAITNSSAGEMLGPEIMVDSDFSYNVSELVSNGDFTNNITGWTAKDSTISYDNGKLKVAGTVNASGGAFQNIGLVTNKYYKMTATMQLLTGSSNGTFSLLTSTSAGTGQTSVYAGSTLVVGGDAVTETFTFTPGTDDVSIQFSSDEASASYTIDNVSVKESLSTISYSLGWVRSASADQGNSLSSGELTLNRPNGENQDYGRLRASNGTNVDVLENGKLYKLVYTISESTGSPNFDFWAGAWVENGAASVGKHTRYFTASHVGFFIRNDVEGSTIKFSSISLKKVL